MSPIKIVVNITGSTLTIMPVRCCSIAFHIKPLPEYIQNRPGVTLESLLSTIILYPGDEDNTGEMWEARVIQYIPATIQKAR